MFIIRAAIMYSNGEVLEGHDYGNIAVLANKLSVSGEKIEGFMTSSGEFILPGDAAVVAVESGQIKSVIGTLKPEDLWAVEVLQ